ncbi:MULTISPECIES: hypothetical protein [Paraburkholderia]|uniref:Uncharacterized protein n=1 Tax=Paraburkholderia tropica TaxID=92647 RepID=A0A1A5X037_9BURK|nr:hypothetical protein [Paraburkholderia tropica]MBB2981016.1 hypothetical protein [Paraburkholderia tropica]MDE1138664.1 hypothetical protein [Paraburkholderia tropica]OBR46694.1 hypothetical protein A6456_30455 [Paraburkholderia tropica]PXX14173.1 hypothetical protein C7400_113107 [Paraburkholderia tropica]PZW79009.1 hypothetical protein C7399_113107 [Paraburkholderia tropica]
MSVPDNSRPKAPPSLLADGPGKPAGAPSANGAPNGSRILANLEGRVVPPASPAGKPQRSSKAIALVALLVVGAGAFGAWHLMTRTPSAASSASTTAGTPASATATASTTASAASAPHAVTSTQAAPEAASASQAATIVADDDSAKAAANSATSAPENDADRLSHALSDGAHDGPANAPAVAAVAPSKVAPEKGAAKSKHESADAKHQTANTHRQESKTSVAQSKKSTHHDTAKKDDSDADLLAVLVARTKPADPKHEASARAGKSATPGNASLAQQVKACGERGFFEDQLCRWRVCDGHWGKDPACPSTARANNEH